MKTICFFCCLPLRNGCNMKDLERDTQYYYQQYRDAGLVKKKFHGVKISQLDKLEKLFELNVQVYSLTPTQNHGEEDNQENTSKTAATLLCRSHHSYSSMLYLNLYENHFSCIKDLACYSKYCKYFSCSSCGKCWKCESNLRRHKKTCDSKVQTK